MRILLTTIIWFLFTLHLSAQNVGIGTTAPEELLHLKDGNLLLQDQHFIMFKIDPADTAGIRFYTSDFPRGVMSYYGTNRWLNISKHDTVPGILYQFNTGRTFIGRNYYITSNEKFGISSKITSPTFGGMYVETNGHSGGKPFYGYAIDSIGVAYHYFDGVSDTWKLNVSGDRMTVSKTTGNVGFGTISPPSERVHVIGTVRVENSAPALNLYQGNQHVAYFHQGGDNLYISNKEAGSLRLRTDDVDRIMITSTGNVGIGTINPLEKLHIIGSARIEDPTPQLKLYQNGIYVSHFLQTGDNLQIRNLEAGKILLETKAITAMTIDSNQFVRLGPGTPLDKLHIDGDMRIQNTVPTLKLYNNGTYASYLQQNGSNLLIRNKLNGGIGFGTNDVPQMYLNNAGNLGIGTVSPEEPFHVIGNARIENTNPLLQLFSDDTYAGFISHLGGEMIISNQLADNLHFRTANIDRMDILGTGDIRLDGNTLSIDAAGNRVGIGVTVPSAKLHIAGNVRIENSDPKLSFYEGNTLAAELSVFSGHVTLRNSNPTGAMRFTTNSNIRMTILDNGNVGIGIIDPAFKLHMDGIFALSGNGAAEMRLYSGLNQIGTLLTSGEDVILRGNRVNGGLVLGVLQDNDVFEIQSDGDVTADGSTFFVDVSANRVGIGTTGPTSTLDVAGSFEVDNTTFKVLDGTNQVLIGTNVGATGYKLCVDGKIIAEEIKVQLSQSWPDYVFQKDYDLMSLGEIQAFIHSNGHLPGVPSAREIKDKNGIALGEMNRLLLEKVEELTLHVIRLQEELDELKSGK